MTTKDTAFVEEQYPTEAAKNVIFITQCDLLSEKHSKAQERVVAITELRVLIIQTKLFGRAVEYSFLLSAMQEISLEDGRIRIDYQIDDAERAKRKLKSKDSHISVRCASDTAQTTLVHAIMEAIEMTNASLSEPLYVEISHKFPPHSRAFELTPSETFTQAFKCLAARIRHPCDAVLLEQICEDIEDSTTRLIEDPLLSEDFAVAAYFKRAAAVKKQKKYAIDPENVSLILQSMCRVRLFEHLLLDAVPLKPIHGRDLAELLVFNDSICNITLRETQIDHSFAQEFVATILAKPPKKAIRLDSFVLSHNDLSDGRFFEILKEVADKVTTRKLYAANCSIGDKAMPPLSTCC
jgi:hypothetical protein